MGKTYELLPSARRLIKSLRDIGHDFSTAVADLVDNSIEAGASRVDIVVGFYGNNSFVRISDNGKGMSEGDLKEAMRYGSEREYLEDDLGKFGLGLKTASMSQCQRFSVASKSKEKSKKVTFFSWDLSHIEKTNKWEILQPNEASLINLISSPIEDHPGTVVLWERLDRILNFKDPSGKTARSRLIAMCRELETYLGMVFHKFLAKEVPEKPLDIYINNNKIHPWDPFGHNESKTKKVSPIKINLVHEGVTDKLLLQPYILPTKEEFSSPEAFKKLSGPSNWNQQQGFYIYRANRMIQSGGWCGLRTSDEHTKLIRIELNFSPVLDNLFKINVSKMRVQLPSQIREDIEQAIKPMVLLARECYDHAGKIPPSLTYSSRGSIQDKQKLQVFKQGSAIPLSNSDLFTIDEIEQRAKELATEPEKKIISRIFILLRKKLFGNKK